MRLARTDLAFSQRFAPVHPATIRGNTLALPRGEPNVTRSYRSPASSHLRIRSRVNSLRPVLPSAPALITTLALGLLSGCASVSRPTVTPGAGPVTEASVRGHMTFLAGDALNGRGSGTRDEWIAATYAASQFQRWGLEPAAGSNGFVQAIEVERAEAATAPVLAFGEQRLPHGGELVVATLAGAVTRGPLQHWKPGLAVIPGAFLLLPADGAPTQATAGAAAVLVRETTRERGRWTVLAARMPFAQHILGTPTLPPARIVLSAALHDTLTATAEGTELGLETELKPAQRIPSWNAVGVLRGRTRPEEFILLSAHIDHLGQRPARPEATSPDTIYNGADDDASGSTAVLELAQTFASGPRPERTVIFAVFGSEEAGGFGSRYFADRPVVPLRQIVANLQFEMIGRPDAKIAAQTLWLTGYERSTLGAELARRGARLVADPHPDQSFFTRSDNIQFARRGVIAHTVSSFGLHEQYHQPTDELGLIDFAHMTTAINSLIEPIRWLANSTFTPAWLPGQQP